MPVTMPINGIGRNVNWELRMRLTGMVLCGCLLFTCADGAADDGTLEVSRDNAVRFLTRMQNSDGSWTQSKFVGITGMVTTALIRSGVPVEDSVLAGGIRNLLSHQQPDGGFYAEGSLHRNYETCITVNALAAASPNGEYREQISGAELFLRDLQWDQGEGIETTDPAWGGGGYGRHQRPDLSNTQYLVDALKAAGVSSDDPAMKRVLIFVSRTQNLESPANDTEFAAKINDGGFYYTPAAGGDSKAGVTDNGGLRSYGSMTYAGLKSLLYAGLSADDDRVKAATSWIRHHYTLKENPGVGQQGLYYYYHTFAKTMHTLGDQEFVDAAGQQHDWKEDLSRRLVSLQDPNGSWQNPADRWFEGDPNLVTAYCLIALSYCD